jgi:hemolysin III
MKNKARFTRYSLGEEIFSSVSHGVGTLLAVAATVLVVVFAAVRGNVLGVISGAIYGATMVILYCMSTLYHSITAPRAKKVLRVIDHCSIFLLIAGTYTPICMCTLLHHGGIPLLCGIWAAAIFGIVLNAVNLEKFRKVSIIFYVVMGLCVVVKMNTLLSLLSKNAITFLALGGAVYLLGIIFYLLKKVKYMHSVWHLFVLGGSVLHFFFILLYAV